MKNLPPYFGFTESSRKCGAWDFFWVSIPLSTCFCWSSIPPRKDIWTYVKKKKGKIGRSILSKPIKNETLSFTNEKTITLLNKTVLVVYLNLTKLTHRKTNNLLTLSKNEQMWNKLPDVVACMSFELVSASCKSKKKIITLYHHNIHLVCSVPTSYNDYESYTLFL